MKKLLFAGAFLFMGCNPLFVAGSSSGDEISYEIAVCIPDYQEKMKKEEEEEITDITIYFPFPHYKGKPHKKMMGWLRENFEKDVKMYFKFMNSPDAPQSRKKVWKETFSNIKLDLIDTKYGKMLKLYIPKLNIEALPLLQYTNDENTAVDLPGRDIRLTEKDKETIHKDYTLFSNEDGFSVIRDKVNKYNMREMMVRMPIYVDFKGKGLKIHFNFEINHYHEAYRSFYLGYTSGARPWVEINKYWIGSETIKLMEETIVTKPGWHFMPVYRFYEVRR